jgi:chemotaxis protein methyltransferase CheR
MAPTSPTGSRGAPPPAGTGPDLPAAEFARVCAITYDASGIKLGAGKEGLVRSRLVRRLRAVGAATFADYLRHVEQDASRAELAEMVDALTTNKTSFFREASHFDYLREAVLPALARRGAPVRVWSAGCSSGEEPYTLGIVACEQLGDPARLPVRILATDISARVLAHARAGVYTEEALEGMPDALLGRYFERHEGAARPSHRVVRRVSDLVRFARLNLMGPWPMQGPFEAIFCRNVMIYFDKATQERLVNRYYDMLAPGGHLFVGHSESLTALSHQFSYVQPAVYRK